MKSEDYIKENELANMPKSISFEILKIIIPKTETCICKIECIDGGHGTGLFCNIPYGWNILKALMTNNHVLSKDDISIGKKIIFSINNEMIYYEIKIDESRKNYTNEKYEITIIELKENHNLEKIQFLDIDSQIFKEDPYTIFINKQIYLSHYPKGKQMEYSMGLIKNIDEDNYTIRYLCDSNSGSSGGPIINSANFQLTENIKEELKEQKIIILEHFLKNR